MQLWTVYCITVRQTDGRTEGGYYSVTDLARRTSHSSWHCVTVSRRRWTRYSEASRSDQSATSWDARDLATRRPWSRPQPTPGRSCDVTLWGHVTALWRHSECGHVTPGRSWRCRWAVGCRAPCSVARRQSTTPLMTSSLHVMTSSLAVMTSRRRPWRQTWRYELRLQQSNIVRDRDRQTGRETDVEEHPVTWLLMRYHNPTNLNLTSCLSMRLEVGRESHYDLNPYLCDSVLISEYQSWFCWTKTAISRWWLGAS